MAKIIKCNRECANWDDAANDCSLGHDVYQSMLGVIYVETCDDYEDLVADEVPDYLGDGEYGYEEEEKPSYRPQQRQVKRPMVTEKKGIGNASRPVPERRKNDGDMNFVERAKQKLAEQRRLQELNERKRRSSYNDDYDNDDDDQGPDPLNDLRETYKKRGMSESLSDIRQFMEDAKAGKINPAQIEEEIKAITKVPIKDKMSDKEAEEERERIRKQLNISGMNEAVKKKKKPVNDDE